ncbi:MAG TPA: divalent metal cation transporter [Ktedonobacterales bacterium]|nr:divalent metal cation transporter [Ktedonobacterales bacterium]
MAGRKGRNPHPTEEPSKTPGAEPAAEIEPGMVVETTGGDLGDTDLSKPKVAEVLRDKRGRVEKLIVSKGVIFRKRIEVPVERVEAVESPDAKAPEGEVVISSTEMEIDTLKAVGTEELPAAAPAEAPNPSDTLARVEETLPTAEGLRRREKQRRLTRRPEDRAQSTPPTGEPPIGGLRGLLHIIGPGFLSGTAGNDSSAVTSYSVNGATNGYSQLWLMVISTPLYQSVQYACAKIGRISGQGLASLLKEHYGRKVALPAALILIVANAALIAADLTAIGSGMQLLTGVAWQWFTVPAAVFLWYITVYQNFGVIKRVFVAMSLVFVAYLVTGIISGANWGAVLRATVIPHISLGFAGISTAVALLGATVSPYTMFWQVQGEREQDRAGRPRHQLRMAALDIGSGTISGNLVAYFIMVSTAATLYLHHKSITTAADAAQALQPLLGPAAKYLFAIGFIGAGIVAIPVLVASTSYVIAEFIGWPASLWRKPWQSEGFYLILTGALLVSLGISLLRVNPIQLMFWANVLQGVLSPVMVVFVLLVGNSHKIMGRFRLSRWNNIGLALTATLMFAAAVLLFYGLATGQGGP